MNSLRVFQGAGYDWTPGEPHVDTNVRESIINWLCWNDKNGSYTDIDCAHDDLEPLTIETARAALVDAFESAGDGPIRFPFSAQPARRRQVKMAEFWLDLDTLEVRAVVDDRLPQGAGQRAGDLLLAEFERAYGFDKSPSAEVPNA